MLFLSWAQDRVTNVLSDCSWQFLYWKFVLVDRRAKIQSGQRTTSFSYLLNDQRGAIGKSLSRVPPQYREAFFMGGQMGKLIDRSKATLRLITVFFCSLCYFDRTPCCFRLVQEPYVEWCLLARNLCGQCVERWRILHRSFRSQVRIFPRNSVVQRLIRHAGSSAS